MEQLLHGLRGMSHEGRVGQMGDCALQVEQLLFDRFTVAQSGMVSDVVRHTACFSFIGLQRDRSEQDPH